MAPNKKKNKKAAANPARGFATTSIISKSKATDDTSDVADQQLTVTDAPLADGNLPPTSTQAQQAVNEPLDLTKLTPEELEAQLENEDLQLFVEKHGARVKKSAARTVSRLLTERRLTRGQAEPLNLGRWLSEESVLEIVGRIRESGLTTSGPSRTHHTISHEELTAKLWALKQALEGLGFSTERSVGALTHIIRSPLLVEQATSDEEHDGLWGLGACLDWLGITCDEFELPGYLSQPDRKQAKVKLGPDASSSDLASAISTVSGTATPGSAVSDTPQYQESTENQIPPNDQDQATSEILNEPEDYDDLDPQQMLDKYIQLKTGLHERRPDLTEIIAPSKRRGNVNNRSTSNPPDAVSRRYLSRIRKIESDLLFDKDSALEIWRDIRIKLIRDAAARKQFSSCNELISETPETENYTHEQPSSTDAAEEADDAMDLGDFFGSLPQEQASSATGVKGMAVLSAEGVSMTVRNFGKWVGVNPRRTLEESCRARDSSGRVIFSLLSTSSFSNRHSVKIVWSKPQDLPDETSISGITTYADGRNVRIEMSSISTPDKHQSEAFISTVALFLIFVPSPKEEKAHLRLPAVWRDLWNEFNAAREERLNGLDREEVRSIRKLVELHVDHANVVQPKAPSKSVPPKGVGELGAERNGHMSESNTDPDAIRSIWASKSSSPYFQRMLMTRKKLPVWAFKEDMLKTIEECQVVIICGETGCGKSTQVPTFILERELSEGRDCKIYCTEPRRISAISLARRVSEELGERKHDVGTIRSLIGYAIRLENRVSSATKLVYATTGIVMRMLENSDAFEHITHIVLDEVHERTIDSDFLLIILKKVMVRRPRLKVILMSATVNAEQFSRYLGGAPIMNVPGRTFPVETKYLEDAVEAVGLTRGLSSLSQAQPEEADGDDEELDEGHNRAANGDLSGYSTQTRKFVAQFNEYRINYELIVRLLEVVATAEEYEQYSKAVLVFLPGLAEIRRVNDMLVGHPTFSRQWRVFPLHSTIATEAQEAAFHTLPAGVRKIVLATNIAETGITIPDITCVIDSGKHREMRFDERRQLSRLLEVFISKANAKQRRGRAGRVQSGLCFHLFTKARHDTIFADQQTPEMLRLSLQDLSLRVKICKLGAIEEVLMEALDPPAPKNIRRAVDSLIEVKALTAEEELTALGRQLAKLPLDVYLGKLILLASVWKCLDAGLTIAAILSSKSPFSAPMGARSQADQACLAFKKGDSDLLTVYNAYCAWRRVCKTSGVSEFLFCRKSFLIPQTLANIEDLKSQLALVLFDAGFLKPEPGSALLHRTPFSAHQKNFVETPAHSNVNDTNELMINSVIAWSFYPKLLSKDGRGWRNVSNNQSVSLHPGSVNKGSNDPPKWLSFYHILQSSSKFYNALETSPVEDIAIALLCGEADVKAYAGVVVIDGNRIRFSLSNWQSMLVFKTLRLRARELVSQTLRSPTKELSRDQEMWLQTLQQIFQKKST